MTTTHPTLTLPVRDLDDPDQRVSTVLERMKAKLGFVLRTYRIIANVPRRLKTHLAGYDDLRLEPDPTAVEQGSVLLAISRTGGSGYCMMAHSTTPTVPASPPR